MGVLADMERALLDFSLTHGGRHQTLAAARLESEVGGGSKLGDALLTLVGWSLLSCPTAGLLARCAVEDGADKEDLRSLAKLGTEGALLAIPDGIC